MIRLLNRFKTAALMTSALLWLPSPTRAQVPVAPLQLVRQQFLSATGVPLAGGCLTFNATGTSTPQAIYVDSLGVVQAPNPYQLDSAGMSNIWLSNIGYDLTAYAGVVNTACSVSLGTQLWKQTNINPFSIINVGSNYIIAAGTSDPSSAQGELAYRTDIPCFRGFTTIWDCFVQTNALQTLTAKTLTSPQITTPTITNPTTGGVLCPLPATCISVANQSPNGTIPNDLAKLTGAPSTVTFTTPTDIGGAIGICISNCTTSGNAVIQQSGTVNCNFDNGGTTTAGDYVQISSLTGGFCHDAGSTYPLNGQVIGRVLTTNSIVGAYAVNLFGPEIKPTNPTFVAASVNLTAQSANISATTLFTPPANGFYRFSCYEVITQAATTSSTLPNCNVIYTDADSSASETIAATAANSSNVLGSLGAVAGNITPNISLYAKSGAFISYSTSSYASSGATPMQYALHIRLEGPF